MAEAWLRRSARIGSSLSRRVILTVTLLGEWKG